MKKTPSTKPTTTSKKSQKPTKKDRIAGRIKKLEATIEKYDSNRKRRTDKLAALKTLLASLSK